MWWKRTFAAKIGQDRMMENQKISHMDLLEGLLELAL